jgi:hypothetical protein
MERWNLKDIKLTKLEEKGIFEKDIFLETENTMSNTKNHKMKDSLKSTSYRE